MYHHIRHHINIISDIFYHHNYSNHTINLSMNKERHKSGTFYLNNFQV